ncbi:uncharacterized protein LOC128726702 [Anopheles nili]|uniref:uncharacterized protein LOC128726702 n=1 Tax=Anopheles nili TaxID=185578 RepID=UPI00237A105D|nr:uncharacterized protein LOC128726702 [Anopheles nili]
MRIMCTIMAAVLGSTLLLVSIVFISASSRLNGGKFAEQIQKRKADDSREMDMWELVSSATVAPMGGAFERMVRFDELKRERDSVDLDQDPLEAENSHLVVQVYSVDSDQEGGNESTPGGSPVRSLMVENFATPKEILDGKPTDRVERKMFPPVRNIQEQLAKVESSEKPDTEALLQERFFVDDSANADVNHPMGRQYRNGYGAYARTTDDGMDLEREVPKLKPRPQPTSHTVPPFYDYNEQSSQRMLDEFFALRNQDAMAARRSNYEWGEGQLRSRTLEEIKQQNRAMASSRKKTPLEQPAGRSDREDDMSYDRYADYAEAEQRSMSYGSPRLGRKQRATPCTGTKTQVLNKVPIVAYDTKDSMPPTYMPDNSHRSQFERSRFQYWNPSMVFNPYAWDPYHMNMLRFPQCNACQQHARALCGKCGLCSDCCAHSKCTCGCLNG